MNEKQQFEKMTTKNIEKLILSLSLPTVLSMLVTGVYNLADTFFVSKLGTSASAAVGIVFSVMTIIQTVGFTLGMGCASLASRKFGEQDNDAANKFVSTALAAAFVLGTLMTIFGQVFLDRLMKFIGATDTILPYAHDYAKYIFYGAPIMASSFVLNNALRSEGRAAFSMVALMSGGLLNIILDPIFIFTFNMGTKGAAIATLISQCVSFILLLQFFLRKKSILKISPKRISKKPSDLLLIIMTGLPSLFRQGLATVATILLNRNASVFGDAAVAGMSIVTRILMMVAGIMVGIGQGFSPVCGYNYGAKKFDRVKQSYWFTVKAGGIIMVVFAVFIGAFAPEIIRLFRDDPDVIAVGSRALRYQSLTLPLHSLVIGTNMLMQSTGKIKQATFLSCNRQGIFFIPLILILPKIFALTGVEVAQAFSDFFSFLVAIPFVIWFFKQLSKEG
ncbi:MAG: MATE family efflux transporter [Treponema sp.]|nr:MATE family efflux transporter [Treponema sp.]